MARYGVGCVVVDSTPVRLSVFASKQFLRYRQPPAARSFSRAGRFMFYVEIHPGNIQGERLEMSSPRGARHCVHLAGGAEPPPLGNFGDLEEPAQQQHQLAGAAAGSPPNVLGLECSAAGEKEEVCTA